MNRIGAAVIVLVLAWLPFLLLSLYNVPIGMHEWDWMTDNAGKLPDSFTGKQLFIYSEIMGRFTSNAALSLTSLWCTPEVFPYFFVIWHLAWMACIGWMLRMVLKDSSWQLAGWFAICLQALYLTSLHDVYDSMYRYTGLLTYQFGAMLSMVAVGLLAMHFRATRNRTLYGALAMVALVLSIGTNEITMIITAWVAALWFFLFRKTIRNRSIVMMMLAVLMISCLAVILAPGNLQRQAGEGDSLGLVTGIGLTLGTTIFLWFDWLSTTMLIPVLLISVPLAVPHISVAKAYPVFSRPRFWVLGLIGMVPLSMGLTVFGTAGNAFPERVIDHLFVYVILACFGLMISLITRYQEELKMLLQQHSVVMKYMVVALSVFVMLQLFGKGLSVNREKTFAGTAMDRIQVASPPSNAWLTLLRGDASRYHAQATAALNSLETCITDTCYMQKPNVLPVQLYDPMSDRRNRNGDGYMGYYYRRNIKLVRYFPD